MNYVFFFPDEMRADSVSCYGNEIVKMPNYDKLAREGVKFENCFTQHPVCSSSRCSLMTGWYPHVCGHRSLWNLLREDEPSLLKYLKQAGYNVQLFGKNDVFSLPHLEQALEKYKDFDYKKYIDNSKPMGKAKGNFNQGDMTQSEFYSFIKPAQKISKYDTNDMKNVQKAIDFINQYDKDDRDFMMFLPILNPHAPYTAPEEFYNMYKMEDIKDLIPADLQDKPDFYHLIRDYRKLHELPEEHFKKIMAVYLGMNSYVDFMLGKLLESIEENNLSDETTIIVSSDHGDWAGDYGLVEKWPSALDDKITKIPLIIKSPNNKAGHVVNEIVELFDIMPTVMELSGLEVKHNHFAKSLVPQLKGAKGDPSRVAYSEGGYHIDEPNCFEGFVGRASDDVTKYNGHLYYPKGIQQQEHPESVCRATMMRSLDYKLIYRTDGLCELYDMKNDKNEITNLYYKNEFSDIAMTMEKQLLKWYHNTADVTPWDEHPRRFPEI